MGTLNENGKGILLEAGTNEVEFLIFQLGNQRYGINVSKVCQILVYDSTKVACLPNQLPELIGITTFRGQSISVVDLRTHLKTDPELRGATTELLLVTEFNQRVTSFIIDGVDRIERCHWEQFKPITDTVCNKGHGSVVGTVTINKDIVIILDLETIMSTIDPATSVDHYQDQIRVNQIDRSSVSIVYCEDSMMIQRILLKTLEEAGFTNFQTFSTGAEGLDYLQKTSPDKVDIIISDIEMPKMDGLTFCKQTRTIPGYSGVPFMFFSSMINEQMQAKCRSVGGDACFSKPEIHLLVAGLEDLIMKKRADLA